MVTTTTGTVTFKGLETGKYYTLSMFTSDVLAAPATFNLAGVAVAGSINFWNAPELVQLVDMSNITGPTVMTVYVAQANDVPTGNVISFANTVNTLPYRIVPNIQYRRGTKVTFVQA